MSVNIRAELVPSQVLHAGSGKTLSTTLWVQTSLFCKINSSFDKTRPCQSTSASLIDRRAVSAFYRSLPKRPGFVFFRTRLFLTTIILLIHHDVLFRMETCVLTKARIAFRGNNSTAPFWKIERIQSWKSPWSILDIFSLRIVYRTRELNKQFYLLGFYPEQTKAMDWLILLFLCSIVLSSITLWIYAWPLLSFFFANGKSHSPYLRAR